MKISQKLWAAGFALWAASACGLFPAAAPAADWPMFGRDSTHNGVSPEGGAPTDWNPGKYDDELGTWSGGRNIRWSARLGTQTFGDPVVADGQVWVGTNSGQGVDASVLAGFATRDGKPLYQFVSPRLPQGIWYDWPRSALACSPLVEGDRMWFTTNRCEVVCLDAGPLKRGAAKPREVWKVDMMQRFGVKPAGSRMMVCHFCSIATYHDLLYVITGNGVDGSYVKVPSPEAPSVICFKKDSGALVWQDNSPGANILDGQWSSPLVIDGGQRAQVVTPQGDGWLRSFDAATGKLIWKFDINPKTAKWVLGGRSMRNNIMATPVLYDGRVYIGSGDYAERGDGPARLVCIDPTKTGDISSELVVDGAGQAVPEDRVQAADIAKGQRAVPNPNSGLVWEYAASDRNGNGKIEFEEQFHRTQAKVAIKDDLLVIGDYSGLIHCVDAKTGKVHWTFDSLASIYAAPLIVGDKVYIGNEDGKVQILRLSAEPQKPLAEIDMNSPIYTGPIFANGTLYIATRDTLFAIGGESVAGSKPSQTAPPSELRGRGLRSVFTPTPQDVVEKMLELASPKKGDVVYDLGSGDGRIVVTASKTYGCRAIGYELDQSLIDSSRAKADAAGMKLLATFEGRDLFTANLADADVVTLYLTPQQLEKLWPQLANLKPGARVVAHCFAIPGVKPDQTATLISKEDHEEHSIFLWTAPLKKPEPVEPR